VGAANELITLFLALELTSIPTYVLLYLPRTGRRTQEAAIKYFLLSVFSSALLLFGFSYLYGVAGTTNLTDLYQHLDQTKNPYAFSFNIPDDETANHQVAFSLQDLNAKRVALLLDSTAFGKVYVLLVTPELEKGLDDLLAAGEKDLDRGRYQEARDAVVRVMPMRPNDPRTAAALGGAMRGLGRTEMARRTLARALELDPRNPRALYEMGKLSAEQGDKPAAVRSFTAVKIADPEFARSHQVDAELAKLR